MIICYHGTDIIAAESILRIGFNVGTWFALHLENAIAYGGRHVFEVAFEESPEEWQFHVLIPISKERIISYRVYQIEEILHNDYLRQKVWGT